MADVKISALPTGSALSGTEIIPIVQGGDTVKATAGQIKDLVVGSGENMLVDKEYVDAKDAQLGADLGDNIEPALAEILNHQNGRIRALEDLVKNMLFKAGQFDTIDIVKQLNIWGGTNLVIVGTAAPSVEPDFIGQMYINTTAGTIYQSKGVTSSDWKQTSN